MRTDYCSCSKRKHHYKPVIYLYPQAKTQINLKVKYNGDLTVTYPEYKDGWNVIAEPDGKLINLKDSLEYSYLFWEGKDYGPAPKKIFYKDGFIVKGDSVHIFLQEKLNEMGLLPKEYNEFIVYWYPILKVNKYNFIHFAVGADYDEISTMEVDPKPDTMLRVFMYYKPMPKFVAITPQRFEAFTRTGFTLVEWGGGPINSEIILQEQLLNN
jgi:hypothetical protein